MSVCIIGAGPSGLSTLHAAVNSLLGLEVHLFDRHAELGGIWSNSAVTWSAHSMEDGLPVHGGMYHGLWSNGPKEALEYQDYTYEHHYGHPIGSFPPRSILLDYMKARVAPDLSKAQIHMEHNIEFVSFDDNTQKFNVFARDLRTDKASMHHFDWLICCIGHFSVPNIPHIEGLETFPGRAIHSKEVRRLEEFQGKSVLVIGNSYSAEDIMQQAAKYGATRVVNVHRHKESHGFDWPKVCDEILDGCPIKVQGSVVSFSDKNNTSAEFDMIVVATGYIHSFPFLDDSLKLRTKNLLYPPLYEGVVLPTNHRMLYIGMQDQFYTWSMFDVQGAFAVGVIAGFLNKEKGIILPKKQDMDKNINHWMSLEGKLQDHSDMVDFQTDYVEQLRKYPFVLSFYPRSYDASKMFKDWLHHKEEPNQGLARHRDQIHRSLFTGNMAPLLIRPWSESFDDSYELYLTDSKEALSRTTSAQNQTTMSTIPSVTTSKQSVVVSLPLGDVWQLIRPGTFEWQTNLVAKTEKSGANRVISYKDKTQQTIQLTEISDRNYKLSWTMIISDPPVSYTSRDDTINLTSITALSQGIKAQTLIEWDSNFSNDVTIEVIMDSNLKKQDAFADLIDMSDTMEIDDSGPNSEIQIVTVPYHGSGIPRKSNFKVVSCNVPEIKDGEILVRSLHISVDPYLRGKLAGLKVKDVPISGTVAEIVETRAQDFKVGDKIFQYLPWRKLNALKPSGPMFRKVSTDLEPSTALGVAGMPGFTAYVGLLKIGKLSKKDKTVFVSAAAGAVGTVVGQIAKIMKCRVVGTCGSAEKCKYLTEELGFDVALNCKTHGTSALMRKAISEKCPDGIDIYFDNTGGHTTEAVFDFLNKFARVPICGQIAYYNATKQPMTEAFLSKTIYKCITIQGFVQNEYLQFHDDFLRDITEWIKNGKVKYRETVLDGFHKVPEAFIGLFSGKNIGKMVVSV